MLVNYTQIHDITVQILLKALETGHLQIPKNAPASEIHVACAPAHPRRLLRPRSSM